LSEDDGSGEILDVPRRPVLGFLVALVIVLTLVALVEYDQIVSLEGRQTSTTYVSSSQVTTSSASNDTVGSQMLVEVTNQSGTTTITVANYQPTYTQTCTEDQFDNLGPCNFNQDGTVEIAKFPQFYYLDITSLGYPSRFTFEGVNFNGTVNDDDCHPNTVCTGPITACVNYSAFVIKDSQTYDMILCTEADQVAESPAAAVLYPGSEPQVGFVWLPDGTIEVLVSTNLIA
jgi:hypothetical protein